MKTKLLICLLSLYTSSVFADKITILKDSNIQPEGACPNRTYIYEVKPKNSYYKYVWSIKGGYFIVSGEKKKEVTQYNSPYVNVVWNNNPVQNEDAKTGKISVKIYEQNERGKQPDTGELPQKIKSLNGILPRDLYVDNTVLDYGVHTISIDGEPLSYPGIRDPYGNLVYINRYEWKVPNGWVVIKGKKTDAGTFITNSPRIKVQTDKAGKGDVRMRGISDCFDSEDYSAYSHPLKFTRKEITFTDYPETIGAGKINSYTITAAPIKDVVYEWKAPAGWSINNGSNTYSGTDNKISVKTSICQTNEQVKARYKIEDGLYSEWKNVPTRMVGPAIIHPSEMQQDIPTSFSINLPDENIESVIWNINGNEKTVYNTSKVSLITHFKVDAKISAEITLKGCGGFLTSSTIMKVTESPIKLSRPTYNICNTPVTFSVTGMPSAAPVKWNVSSSLRIISTTANSITVKNSGISDFIDNNAYVHADIGAPYDAHREQNDLTVWKTGINRTNELIEVRRIDNNNMGSGSSTLHQYIATLEGDLLYSGLPASPEWKVEGDHVNTLYNDGTSIVFETNSDAWITATFMSPCGEPISILHHFVNDSSYDNGLYFALSPNPATNSVSINIGEKQTKKRFVKKMNSSSYLIQLWNSYHLIKQVYTNRKQYQLDITGLPAGSYYVIIVKDGYKSRKQLIIK